MANKRIVTLAEAKAIIAAKGYTLTWLPGTTTYEILTLDKRGQGLRSFDDVIAWATTGRDPYRYFDIPCRF